MRQRRNKREDSKTNPATYGGVCARIGYVKKVAILVTLTLWPLGTQAFDVFYPIIGSASSTGFTITINTITKRLNYECLLETLNCIQTGETVSPYLEGPLIEVAKEETTDFVPSSSATPSTSPIAKPYSEFNYPLGARHFSLSPDGKKLAYFVSNSEPYKWYGLYVLESDDGKKLERFDLVGGWELVTDNGKLFDFTSDSSKLVYLDDRSGFQQLYLVDLSQNQQSLFGEPLITRPYTVINFLVHGNIAYFIANRENPFKWGLYGLDLNSRHLTLIAPEVLYTNNLVMAGDYLIFTIVEDGAGVVRTFDTEKRMMVNLSGIATATIPVFESEEVITESLAGIFKPAAKQSNKAIIWVHGGPYRQASSHRHPYGSYATYDWMLDEMISAGVNVFKLEYPGSFGFGRSHALDLVGNVGFSDVLAVERAVDFLHNHGIKEIYIFGNSYGGYLALKSLSEMPDKIAGAVAVAPITDWAELVGKMGLSFFSVHFGGLPGEANQPLYEKSRFISKLDDADVPALIFHGELDRQIPFEQSDFLLKNLASNNRIRYFRVRNQGHVISGVSQNEAICSVLADFIGVTSMAPEFCKLRSE